jgi:hypothetical protein
MAAPQDSPKRRKQKARRSKQLAEWRARHPKKEGGAAKTAEKKAAKAPAKK